MAVLKEWVCMAHGVFESYHAVCPHGCTTVQRHFKTAFTLGNTAKGIDRTLQNLANDFGMTDISNRNGTAAGFVPKNNQQQVDLNPRWSSGGLAELQKQGHQLGDSGLNMVKQTLTKPENQIPSHIRNKSAQELK